MSQAEYIIDFVMFSAILVAVIVACVTVYRRRPRKDAEAERNSPMLLGYYINGVDLHPIKKGTIGDMHYATYATLAERTHEGFASVPMQLYRVELPFHTSTHLLGIPRSGGTAQLDPSGKYMERVSLEGDYDTYFSLYAERGLDADTQYVLDPKAMVFTIDFCQSHSWEIINNELYFAQPLAGNAKENTDYSERAARLEQNVMQFVAEIRPALQTDNTRVNQLANAPYGEDRRKDLKCPICSAVLGIDNGQYVCLEGHGILLQARQIQKLKIGQALPPAVQLDKSVEHGELVCPSCGFGMSRVAFNGSKTFIDTCVNCPYRWLDGRELDSIFRKPGLL